MVKVSALDKVFLKVVNVASLTLPENNLTQYPYHSLMGSIDKELKS